MAIGRFGKNARHVGIAVEIADQPADVAHEGGETPLARCHHPFGHLRHPDIDGDVPAQQIGRDAKVDIVRHAGRGMVGDDQHAAGTRRAKDAERLAHRRLPARRHHTAGSAAAAASRAAAVS